MIDVTSVLFSSDSESYSKLKSLIEGYSQCLLLMDENTLEHCRTHFLRQLNGQHFIEYVLKPNEQNKNLDQIHSIYEVMLLEKMDRNSVVVNLGGGIVCDMGGFAASTFKRGIDYINIPTTLLSCVDASIGGKTGVNFNSVKNQIGTFCHPKMVFVDPKYLDTLPLKELKSGFAEVVKHALISGKDHFSKLQEIEDLNAEYDWTDFIKSSIEIKTNIVQIDPNEHHERKKLNYGHTIGHALESLFGKRKNKISHGHAVAIGMILEAELSKNMDILSDVDFKEIKNTIMQHFDDVQFSNVDVEELISLMQHDKKNKSGNINFTLPIQLGNAIIDQSATQDEIREVLLNYSTDREV